MEAPECPVCLQSYDGACTVPRVLTCGHTACEDCLTNLPKKFPDTIRCPACTVLVRFPPQGPSALPKNIDLLRLFPSNLQSPPKHSRKSEKLVDFVPRSWSDDLYNTWKDRILPYDAVSMDNSQNEEADSISSPLLCGLLKKEEKVSLLHVASFQYDNTGSIFKYSYLRKIMNCLREMKDETRDELDVISSVEHRGICRVFGLWGNLKDGFLYIVGAKLTEFCLNKFDHLLEDNVTYIAIITMQICEALLSLHKDGIIIGCLSLSCLKLDDFGNAYINLIEVLKSGRDVNRRFLVGEANRSKKPINLMEMETIICGLLKEGAFMSFEVLSELLKKHRIITSVESLESSISYSSDAWSLGFLLLKLLLGKQRFEEELLKRVDFSDSKGCREGIEDLLESNLQDKFNSMCRTLCKCCSLVPGDRSDVKDLWRSMRELIINPSRVSALIGSDNEISDKGNDRCLVLGELTYIVEESRESERDGELLDVEIADKDFLGKMSIEGKVKSKEMCGHLDCITDLAIGGGFLFSSSFDRNIHVWSLQDYSHVHTFKGHEDKVMALVYIDGADPLCVSGDSGGGVFVWAANLPLRQEPLRKWYEPKDWRYSGIHALAFSKDGYLYSGSGDKTIKGWRVQDGNQVCTMSGHKSVVSALVVQNGVLYSGSWDGSVRLWSLNDHSLLTVLGLETPDATLRSILCLSVHENTLVAAHEDGTVKIWRDDVFMRSMQLQSGAILGIAMEGNTLFAGGWDKSINLLEVTGDEISVDCKDIGSISCSSVITSLLCLEGKLFVGFADKDIKVYYHRS